MVDTIPREIDDATHVLAVTLLTSISQAELRNSGVFRSDLTVEDLVLKRVEIAFKTGCTGVVCSAHEALAVKQRFGSDFLVVTPGIRPQWGVVNNDDQQRVATPADAIRNGADYVVIGRPIRDAKDPVNAANRVIHELAENP